VKLTIASRLLLVAECRYADYLSWYSVRPYYVGESWAGFADGPDSAGVGVFTRFVWLAVYWRKRHP